MTTKAQVGDRILVKLDDANWQSATVITREVIGHGTPARSVTYYVNVKGLHTTVHSSKTKEM